MMVFIGKNNAILFVRVKAACQLRNLCRGDSGGEVGAQQGAWRQLTPRISIGMSPTTTDTQRHLMVSTRAEEGTERLLPEKICRHLLQHRRHHLEGAGGSPK